MIRRKKPEISIAELLDMNVEKFFSTLKENKNLINKVNETAFGKTTLLHELIQLYNTKTPNQEHNVSVYNKIRILVELGVKLDAVDHNGKTPLQYANNDERLPVFAYLLKAAKKQHINLNKSDNQGETILSMSLDKTPTGLAHGTLGFLFEIASDKIDFNKKIRDVSPLVFAIDNEQYQSAVDITFKGADPEKKAKFIIVNENQKEQKIDLNIFQYIDYLKKRTEDPKEVDLLVSTKANIGLARLTYLAEKAIQDHSKNRTSWFRKDNPKRNLKIQDLEIAVKEAKSGHAGLALKNSENLIVKLQKYAAENDQKKRTLLFWDQGSTSSGLSRDIKKILAKPFLKQMGLVDSKRLAGTEHIVFSRKK